MIYEGNLLAAGQKIALVCAKFNDAITSRLLEGAISCFVAHGGDKANIDIIYVPGAFEIGVAVKMAAASKKYDGIATLGCVIRGGTPHFEYVAGEAASAVSKIAIDLTLPIAFGVLTTDSIEQAVERAGTKMGNKGWEATQALIETINVKKSFQ